MDRCFHVRGETGGPGARVCPPHAPLNTPWNPFFLVVCLPTAPFPLDHSLTTFIEVTSSRETEGQEVGKGRRRGGPRFYFLPRHLKPGLP